MGTSRSKKRFRAPEVKRVRLNAEEAVLAFCKVGDATGCTTWDGWTAFGGPCGFCQLLGS